jgi:general secretion pathway protein I
MMASNGFIRSHGVSLVEVLVAFVILALSITVLLRIFSTGLTNTVLSQQYVEAVLVAETQLSQVGLTNELIPEIEILTGTSSDIYHWQTRIEPYTPWEDQDPETIPVSAYLVNVEVWWQERGTQRSINLSRLKLTHNIQLDRRG